MSTSRLDRLEGASLQLLWEAVAEAKRPVMLQSDDRESAALLRLARRAFHPAEPPFPLVAPEELAAATAQHGFDLVIDGDVARAGAGRQPPPVWRLVQAMKQRGETFRISPLAGWSELDVRHYVGQALGDGTALSLHTCGGTGTGKSVLAALLSTATARRSPDQRSLLVTDVPGQDRDPRGVVTAASTADLSVVVVDARQGLSTPVKRDIVLLSLLGVARSSWRSTRSISSSTPRRPSPASRTNTESSPPG